MGIMPVKDRIAVIADTQADKTKSGLYIPEAYKDKSTSGLILEVGEDVSAVKKGQRILFSKHAGVEVEVDDMKVKIITDDDVYGVLTPSDDELAEELEEMENTQKAEA